MEKLIKEINAFGYSVAIRQYNKLKVNNEALWDATATHISRDNAPHTHIHMDEICFGRSAEHVLGKLRDKVKEAAAKKAAKTYDPFEDAEDEEWENKDEDAFA